MTVTFPPEAFYPHRERSIDNEMIHPGETGIKLIILDTGVEGSGKRKIFQEGLQ